MENNKIFTALGLMSGTSIDGIDAAIIKTDGHSTVHFGPFITRPYSPEFKKRLRAAFGTKEVPRLLQHDLTLLHAELIEELFSVYDYASSDIDVIGFHGQTIFHEPLKGFTLQIGDGALLADLLDTTVVNNFRKADVMSGGYGAPLTPIYHKVLAEKFAGPVVVVNIGGVSNVSYISKECLIGFDSGPGNALIDDIIKRKIGVDFDDGGRLAKQGRINQHVLAKLLEHDYFKKAPPKALDRNEFDFLGIDDLLIEDAVATLVAFTTETIVRSALYLPQLTKRWLVTGGGRHNSHMMSELSKRLGFEAIPVEDVGWDGDALEAQAFAFLAVRSILSLPLSFPSTTGVQRELTGGDIYNR